LKKHGISFEEERNEKYMKTTDNEINDDLRDEYDLTKLRIRKLGSARKSLHEKRTVRKEKNNAISSY